MHYRCKTRHDSCTVSGCRTAARRRSPGPRIPGTPRPSAPAPAAEPRGHPPGAARRAARLHPQPGRRSARRQPLHLHPARPPLRRDDRDALGRTADPGRRARATPRRTSTTRQAAPGAGASEAARGSSPNRSSNESRPRTPPARAWARSHASSTPTASRPHKAADNGGPQPSEPCSLAPGVNDARPALRFMFRFGPSLQSMARCLPARWLRFTIMLTASSSVHIQTISLSG